MAAQVKPIPDGYHTATPYLRVRGAAQAIEFYKAAFGAEETVRLPSPDGKMIMHAEVRIGDSVIMLGEESEQWNAPSPLSLGGTGGGVHLYVRDVDATIARAVAAGAKLTMPPADMFWGDRYGKLLDPFGHEWSVATHTSDPTPQQIAEGAKAAFAKM
jgi:PhnB protein